MVDGFLGGQVSAPGTSAESPIQVIQWGANQDLAYNAAGGGATTAGPFNALVLRLAIISGNVRIGVGASAAAAAAMLDPGTLLVGPEVEHMAIQSGSYVAAISNDTSAGSLNITEAL